MQPPLKYVLPRASLTLKEKNSIPMIGEEIGMESSSNSIMYASLEARQWN